MGMTDIIESMINEMLDESGCAKLRRNELAEKLSCVPSQINYVISTRFSPEHGYTVESRRGGGGYVLIRRVRPTSVSLVMHTVNSVGSGIGQRECMALINGLYDAELISKREMGIIASMLTDTALSAVPWQVRDTVRADLLKRALVATE